MEYVLIGIGGALGSAARYGIGRFIAAKLGSRLPVGTFAVNISGAFLLGVFYSLSLKYSLRLLIAEGFFGAYTTFSTFMFEGFELFRNRKKLNALVYITGSVIFGVLGFGGGVALTAFL